MRDALVACACACGSDIATQNGCRDAAGAQCLDVRAKLSCVHVCARLRVPSSARVFACMCVCVYVSFFLFSALSPSARF